jgi:hypothetical protein
MTIGPGRYDDLCTMVREATDAEGVIIIVLGGDRGHGFSCQFTDPAMLASVPGTLETIADQVRKDMEQS